MNDKGQEDSPLLLSPPKPYGSRADLEIAPEKRHQALENMVPRVTSTTTPIET